MMHFPQFVLKSFIIGTALLFPTVALADKTDHAHTGKIKKTALVTNGQKIGDDKKESNFHSEIEKPLGRDKVVKKIKPLLNQAKKLAKTTKKAGLIKIKHDIKNSTSENPGKRKWILKREKITSVKQKTVPNQVTDSKQDVSDKNLPRFVPKRKSHVFVSRNADSVIQSTKQEPVKSKELITKKASDSHKQKQKKKKENGFPRNVQVITTTLGNDNSTGSSKDRLNMGENSLNYTVKWFEWEKYRSLSFSQAYISRSYKLCNQWTNAPPVQPPKSLPFL